MKKIIKGAIYYIDLNLVDSSKQNKFIPVLTLQSNNGFEKQSTIMIAPIATKDYIGEELQTHVIIKEFENVRPNSIVLLDQIRSVDKNRLSGYVGLLGKNKINEIDRIISILLELK